LCEVWARVGVRTRLATIPDANHFTVISALADPASAMVREIVDLTS